MTKTEKQRRLNISAGLRKHHKAKHNSAPEKLRSPVQRAGKKRQSAANAAASEGPLVRITLEVPESVRRGLKVKAAGEGYTVKAYLLRLVQAAGPVAER